MKKPKFPEISKLPTPWKAEVVGLAVLLATAAYEAIKQQNFGNLTPWESHTITISYCTTLAPCSFSAKQQTSASRAQATDR